VALLCGLVRLAVLEDGAGPTSGADAWIDGPLGLGVLRVLGVFLSFLVGGWTAGSLSGIRAARAATVHGIVVWLVAVPILVLVVPLGAGGDLAGYGLVPVPSAWRAQGDLLVDGAPWRLLEDGAANVLKALTLGLAAAGLGGWMATGSRARVDAARGLPR
jgi:hypothetical protein